MSRVYELGDLDTFATCGLTAAAVEWSWTEVVIVVGVVDFGSTDGYLSDSSGRP